MTRLMRRALLPPAYAEDLSPAQWRAGLVVRVVFLLTAVGLDLMIAATLGALEAVTVIVWVQATGSLTGYFVLTGVMIMVLYRIMFSYRVGAAVLGAGVVAHASALILEAAGVLRPEALFVNGPSAAYDIPLYRVAATSSIFMSYVLMFVGANVLANRLRTKDLALAEVQREAACAAEDARHGRLTGALVAGEFAMGELIGRGGMGEVYMARRVSDDSTVAVKVLHAHLLDDADVLERFHREAEIAARVPSRFVARVLDIGSDPQPGRSSTIWQPPQPGRWVAMQRFGATKRSGRRRPRRPITRLPRPCACPSGRTVRAPSRCTIFRVHGACRSWSAGIRKCCIAPTPD